MAQRNHTEGASGGRQVLLDTKLGEETTLVTDLDAGDTVLFEYDLDIEILPGGVYRFTEPTFMPDDRDAVGKPHAHQKLDPIAEVSPLIMEYRVTISDEYILYVAGEHDCPGDGGHVTVSVLS